MTTHSILSMAVFGVILLAFPAFFIVNRMRGPRPAGPPIRWHWLEQVGLGLMPFALMLFYIELAWAGLVLAVLSAGLLIAGGVIKPGGLGKREAGLIALYLAGAALAVWMALDRLF